MGWLKRKQWAFEEQGFMMFEKRGKRKLEDICEQIIFSDVNEGAWFRYGIILSYRGQLHTRLLKAHSLQGMSEFSSAKFPK